LFFQVITRGDSSHRLRIATPLRPLDGERRLHSMNNQYNAYLVETKISSFDEIILPHLDAAHNLARWLVRNSDDAEDVVQEACLRAFRYFGTFRRENARAWLLRIVRTTSFSWLQQNRRRQVETDFDEEIHRSGGKDLNPETLVLQRANAQLVDQALRQLPDRLREVLVLRELEGLSYKEIADVVGIPMGTVMSTLSRARERLLSDLVRRQEQPKGPSAVSDAKLQETETDAVSV
jgi:RNA polymerase sigma-70 factor (ECF subfamily)